MSSIVPYNAQITPSNPNVQGSPPVNGRGQVQSLRKEGKISRALGTGMIAFDSYGRIKDGENPMLAIGKAAVTNMAWNLVPGGFVTMGAMAAASMAPELIRMTDAAKSNISSKSSAFGGGYTQNEGQAYMQQMGIGNGLSARQQASAIMSKHARSASRSY